MMKMIKILYMSLYSSQAYEFLKILKSDLERRGVIGIEVDRKKRTNKDK